MTLDEELRITQMCCRMTRWVRDRTNAARARLNLPPREYPADRWDDANASHNQ